MTFQKQDIQLRKLPDDLRGRRSRDFLSEIQSSMNGGRPRIVLDGSDLRELDRSAILLILCCLEEAMKCNGDVKLAALPLDSEEILRRSGTGRLFETYRTVLEAENSFDSPVLKDPLEAAHSDGIIIEARGEAVIDAYVSFHLRREY
jgi:anti-anti-sigma regulatory factor